jgi:hypothetical protein
MAALARPQGPIGSGGLKAAAIGFAVLAVAAITFTIIMFTQRADLQSAADQATQQASQQQKAASQARQDLREVAKEVIGKEAEALADVKAVIDPIRKTVTDDPNVKKKAIPADQPVGTMLNSLYALFRSTAEQANKLAAERDDLNKQLTAEQKDLKAKTDEFNARIAELETKYTTLTAQSEQYRNKAGTELAELQAARTKEREDFAKELDAARKAKETAEITLKKEKNRAEDLVNQLAQFKPSGGGGSVLQVKDGVIVRIVPDGDVVYIDLGKRENLKPGMTFSVYSPIRGIPADGKGKATIEVASVFDTTAECRVTSRVPGEPLLVDDIIANPVFDRTRQYHFAVAGDFDLNFDGQPEDPAGKEVIRLIERLGGKVVGTIDSNTDFLVLGSPPPAQAVAATGTELDAAAVERNTQLAQRRQLYDAALREARSLSIPVLTRTQLLHFMGQLMPKNTPDDKLPAS